MRGTLRHAALMAVAAAVLVLAPLSHGAEQPAQPEPAKPVLKLNAKSIIFDRSTGDVFLKGEVHVVRTIGEDVLTVWCDEMTAQMKDGKMETVEASGSVRLETKDFTASAARASLEFSKNVIVLYGEREKPAVVRSAGMVSSGSKIIFHMDAQRVEMPEGGDTIIELNSPQPEKGKTPAQ